MTNGVAWLSKSVRSTVGDRCCLCSYCSWRCQWKHIRYNVWTEIEVWNSAPVPGADISNAYISWIDREGPWHLSAGSGQTHTHKLSNHVLSATSTDIAVQLRFRPTHSPLMEGEACNLQVIGSHNSLPTAHWFPLWTRWCIPTSLLAHWRTACSQVYPISLSLCCLMFFIFILIYLINFLNLYVLMDLISLTYPCDKTNCQNSS